MGSLKWRDRKRGGERVEGWLWWVFVRDLWDEWAANAFMQDEGESNVLRAKIMRKDWGIALTIPLLCSRFAMHESSEALNWIR